MIFIFNDLPLQSINLSTYSSFNLHKVVLQLKDFFGGALTVAPMVAWCPPQQPGSLPPTKKTPNIFWYDASMNFQSVGE